MSVVGSGTSWLGGGVRGAPVGVATSLNRPKRPTRWKRPMKYCSDSFGPPRGS